MQSNTITRTAVDHEHDAFTESIPSFPTLKDNEKLYREDMTPMDRVRNDYLETIQDKDIHLLKQKYQMCFSLEERYIPFCLEHNFGVSLQEAAKVMGLKK